MKAARDNKLTVSRDRPGKPTTQDIARHAGVSLATVDRVLNARSGVRSVTIERVNRAIEELGYIRDTAAANLARRRIYKLAFVLPDSCNGFVEALRDEIVKQQTALHLERTQLQILPVAAFDSRAIAATLDEFTTQSADGIALIAPPETPVVRDAINRLHDRGIAVVVLLSDLPSSARDHFIGIDNAAAGNTAASLMGRFIHSKEGRVLVLTGSRVARDHLERRYGFDNTMQSKHPGLKILPTLEIPDQQSVGPVLNAAFENWADIRGVYVTAFGSGEIIRFLGNMQQKPVVIAHELTPVSRAALQQGHVDALISQDRGHIVRSAVRLLRATTDAVPFNATQERIRIDIFLKENLPPD